MKKMSLSTREKQIFFLAFVLCSVYLFYIVVYIPFQKRSMSLKKEIRNMQRELARNNDIISQNRSLESKYSVILDEFKQKGTDEQVMATMLSDIEKVKEKINISISEKKPRKAKTVGIYNQFSVSLILEGTLKDIAHFVYDLQSNPYMMRVDEMRIDKKSRLTSVLRCHLILSRVLIP